MFERLKVRYVDKGWKAAIMWQMNYHKQRIIQLEQACSDGEIDDLLNPVRTQEMMIRHEMIKELGKML